MSLQVLEAQTGENPRASILVLHGLGADGRDFVPVAEQLDLSPVGPVRYIFPSAPEIPVTINGGYVMPAWYDILGADLAQRQDEAGMRRTQAAIDQLIAREVARGMPASRIVLAGFSQGCAMALMTGLRHRERLAGILGLSGYLPLADKLALERSPANADVPIFLAHGSQDDVVRIDRARASRDLLLGMGYPVQWQDYAMGHTLCLEELQDMQAWLRQVLD
jgi:phospholipase/carboxylesterase